MRSKTHAVCSLMWKLSYPLRQGFDSSPVPQPCSGSSEQGAGAATLPRRSQQPRAPNDIDP